MKPSRLPAIGIIPAAGRATRLGSLPISKEILPISFQLSSKDNKQEPRTRVISEHLLNMMSDSEIENAFMIIREGKWDIPQYLESQNPTSTPKLAYVATKETFGVPFSLDYLYPFVKYHPIALGFPDILFDEPNAFISILSFLKKMKADVVLGLFPADNCKIMDMVNLNSEKLVTEILVKPKSSNLKYTWGIAAWSPLFSKYLNDQLEQIRSNNFCFKNVDVRESKHELQLGKLFQYAISDGLKIYGLPVSDKPFMDIGNPENLAKIFSGTGKI